jgi:hypothetical protein
MGSHWYYVSEQDLNEEVLFKELCRRKRISRSHLIAQWRKAWLREQLKDVAKIQSPALEDYLSSEKSKMRERSERLDVEWNEIKKRKGL